MRRVLHLVWFDMLALRVPLALWVSVLVLEGALFYAGPLDPPNLPELGRVNVPLGLAMVRMLASVIIVALLVHADPTVGTTAFWRSRPIARPALLASKLISAALWLGVLPGIVTAMVLSRLGTNFADSVSCGLTISYEQSVITFIALALAIVTRDLVQCIVAAVSGLGLVTILESTLWPAALRNWPAIRGGLTSLPAIASATIVIWLAAFVVVHQYLTLRRRHSVVMLACAVIVASIALKMGPSWTDQPAWPAPVPSSLVSPSEVVFSGTADTQAVRDAPLSVSRDTYPRSVVSFEAVLSGEPEALYIRPVEVKSTVEFQDRSVYKWTARMDMPSMSAAKTQSTVDDQPYRGLRKVLGSPELFISPSTKRRSYRYRVDVAQITQKLLEGHRGEPARLDATVTLLAYQHEITATLPLRPGSSTSIPNSGALSIESVRRTSRDITVGVRETSRRRYPDFWNWSSERQFVVRNAARGLALMDESVSRRRSTTYTTFFADAQVATSVFSVVFALPDASAGGSVVDDEWMKGAEFVLVDAKLVGSVIRSMRLDSFVVGGGPKK